MKSAICLLIAIFICDMLIPFGIALALLYTVCILLVVKERRRTILIMTAVASFLTISKFIVHYQDTTAYYFIVNRGISVITLCITAAIAIKFRLLQERQQLINEIERKTRETEQFIYIASHDLNEPLRTVRSMTDLLERRYASQLDEQGNQFLYFINNSIDRMTMLINSLLEYGLLGRNAQMTKVPVSKVVADAIDDLAQLLQESQAKVVVETLPTISIFESELRLLFQNLIANAVKFSRPGTIPVVNISARFMSDHWLFTVSDNGIGIEKDHIEKIFTIFKKLHSREEYDGTGIGLAHCRKIIEMHHGSIWAASDPGKGSTFYFTIPTN